MAKQILTAERARELFRYDAETGDLFWKERASRRHPDRPLRGNSSSGYYKVMVDRGTYLVHRICWLVFHGVWPVGIDHINGLKTDNRLCNLREATQRQNAQNMRSVVGLSGVQGVSWSETRKKWRAAITDGRRYISLGYFSTIPEAQAVYLKNKRERHEFSTI